ncbi:CDP-glycerol glycerophosphotransferase family protein [Thalassobacillus sp. C254]|uniref:CDP-glycerol glycerophosphotransferase family protein n=1 Tax=Thalassobacillus sp. C254 TaxID=1225341 RepID=UPI0006D0FBAF|nr:CDP-glycerol glycerophosphotransferase family protein [Thalassobacillus sp. C254]
MKIRKVHTLFKKYSFSGVLYGSTINRHGALVTTFAQTRKIKTVNLQHGLLGEIGHLPVNAHLNFVWGKSHQDYLLAFGAPKQKIKMVPPVFIRNNSLGLSDFTDKRSVPPAPPLKVLVALQPLGAQHNHTMIRRIENAAKRYPGKVLVSYKLHPDQSRKLYQKQIRSSSSKLLSHSGNSLHNLMKWCDIIITPYSTVAYEGLLCKKAVVFYGRPQPFYYLKGCATFVKTEEDIKKLFLQLIKHPTFLSTLINQLSLKDNIKNHSYAPLAIENYL